MASSILLSSISASGVSGDSALVSSAFSIDSDN